VENNLNNLDELYKIYGSLLIQLEILQNRINETKKQIAEALNQKNKIPPPDKE
jgi:seryl-tRNA synthetase